MNRQDATTAARPLGRNHNGKSLTPMPNRSPIGRGKRSNAKAQRREGAKILAELHRVRARQPRTPSALGRRKTVSMSKLVSDLEPRCSHPGFRDGYKLMSPVFLLPRHALRTAGLSSTLTPVDANRATSRPVRQRRAKPEAEREAKGEASLLAEACVRPGGAPEGSRRTYDTAEGNPFRLSSVFLCALCVSVFALLHGSASIFRSNS